MPESFHTLEQSPPLRITVDDLAKLGDQLVRQADVGGEVTIKYAVDYDEGLRADYETTAAFREGALAADADPEDVTITVEGWTQPAEKYGRRDNARSYYIYFRNFGSQFQIHSSDPNWGRGATQTLNTWLKRHSPRYRRLVSWFPQISGIVIGLAIGLVLVAATTEKALTLGFFVVLALSAVVLAANVWLFQQYQKKRFLPHTRITREKHERNTRSSLRVVAGVVAFVADVVTIIVLLAR